MFTGIVEQTATIASIVPSGANIVLTMKAALVQELQVDQSVSHNGICLTVESIKNESYSVTAIQETITKTTIGDWQAGRIINLERCLRADSRFDGHIVQGHVDAVGICTARTEKQGSWEYRFKIEEKFASLIIEKGSIALDGISLTIFNVTETEFTIAVIPYTYAHTAIHLVKPGDRVNLEFDMIGKYVNRIKQLA